MTPLDISFHIFLDYGAWSILAFKRILDREDNPGVAVYSIQLLMFKLQISLYNPESIKPKPQEN